MHGETTTAKLFGAVQNAWAARWLFLITFLVVLFVTLSALIALDIIPDAPKSTALVATTTPVSAVPLSPTAVNAFAAGELPTKVQVPAIGLSATIANPATTNIETLDQYLLKGAVRYPTSGLLGENGNVVLFGHSSYLPIVNNLAYKTFDGIQKLKAGDTIIVSSSDHTYTYAVDMVDKESAATDDAIPLTVTGQHLTLATCDSFGEKTDRFVVTATLVSSSAL